MIGNPHTVKQSQRGVSAIEFALVAVILLTLLFGIIEFGRLFFTINSVQEITRRAAREQVVNWVDRSAAVKRVAVLRTNGTAPGTVNFPNASGTGAVNFPGSPDITNAYVQLSFLNQDFGVIASQNLPASPAINFENCLSGEGSCIRFVRATLSQDEAGTIPLDFNVLAPYMPSDVFPLPRSTVIMPAEALGLL